MNPLHYKTLLLFSLPSILASLLGPLSGVIDTALVGRLNTSWLAALTVGAIIFNSTSWIFNFLIHTSTQGLSHALATRESSRISESISTPVICALGLGITSVVFLYPFRMHLYVFAGASSSLLSWVDAYFLVRLIGLPALLLYSTLISLLRGFSKVALCLYLALFTTLLNIILSYLFLYQFHWGPQGAAWGSVIADFSGMILSFFFLFSHMSKKNFHFSWRLPRVSWVKFGRNSLNLFFRSLILTSIFFISTKLAGNLGIVSLAAHQIILQCWLISSYFIDGLAITANILSAKYKAKGLKKRFKTLSVRLMILGGGIGLIFNLFFIIGAQTIWQLFTNDFLVIAIMGSIWPLIAYSQVFNAIAFVMDGLLFGTGEFAFLRRHMAMGFLIMYLPFAFYSAWYKSFPAIWWGLALLNVYRMASGGIKLKKMQWPIP